jgi:SAM-dependent methyltransferase
MKDFFLNPECRVSSLDTFVIRSSILRALKEAVPQLSGTLLDVGCGNMPYKSLLLAPQGFAKDYIGMDIDNRLYRKPDVFWDGCSIPMASNSADCAVATEVIEHIPDPENVMKEIYRVLKPGGTFFFTVPFLWPLHDVPGDQYRYTPFSLERHLSNAGFETIELKALGGWNASLAQMLGLWVRRRPMPAMLRIALSCLALPLVKVMASTDSRNVDFIESQMVTGLAGTCKKPDKHET